MRQVLTDNSMEIHGDISKRFCSNEFNEAKSNINLCNDSSHERFNVSRNENVDKLVSETENCDLDLRDDTSQNKPMESSHKDSL